MLVFCGNLPRFFDLDFEICPVLVKGKADHSEKSDVEEGCPSGGWALVVHFVLSML